MEFFPEIPVVVDAIQRDRLPTMANILLIDDDTMLTEMLTEHLDRAGHCTTTAATLNDGIEQARNGSFDIVFLDVQLPDGDGLQAFPRFSEAPSKPEIIIMTGAVLPPEDSEACNEYHFPILEKPFLAEQVLAVVRERLQRSSTATSA